MAEQTEQGTHFYFMVVQTPVAGGVHVSSQRGTCTPERGATRLDLFNAILAEAVQASPISANGNVIAFDIQPNQL